MSLNLVHNNDYVYVDEHNTSIYSIGFSNNINYFQMFSYYKRYQKDSSYFNTYDLWKDVNLPSNPHDNIPHLFDVNLNSVYKYSNQLLEDAYNQAVLPAIPAQLYPIATRYIDIYGNYYIERPPFQVDIDYKIGNANSSTKKRVTDKKVWVPWTLFIFNPENMGNARMVFSHKSLTHDSDIYISSFLPNNYSDGSICYSNSLNTIPDIDPSAKLSISQIYSLMINEYFAGAWNSDLSNTWSTIYNNFIRHVFRFFPEDKHLYPQLNRLFLVTNEDISKILPSNSKPYKLLMANEKYIERVMHLDYPYFHEYILSALASFSLQDVLALVEELSTMYLSYITPDHKYYNKFQANYGFGSLHTGTFNYVGNFASLKATVQDPSSDFRSTNLSDKILNRLSSFPVLNSIPSDYSFFKTNILLYNSNYEVDHYYLRYDSNFSYCNNILSDINETSFFKLMNTIIHDLQSNVSISDNMYCLDAITQQIHVLPYSFDLYKKIVSDSTISQINILEYINDKV